MKVTNLNIIKCNKSKSLNKSNHIIPKNKNPIKEKEIQKSISFKKNQRKNKMILKVIKDINNIEKQIKLENKVLIQKEFKKKKKITKKITIKYLKNPNVKLKKIISIINVYKTKILIILFQSVIQAKI